MDLYSDFARNNLLINARGVSRVKKINDNKIFGIIRLNINASLNQIFSTILEKVNENTAIPDNVKHIY